MLQPEVEKICGEIKALRIQGARNIAIAAVKALNLQAQQSGARNCNGFYADLLEAADALAATRPTEPMLRNSLRNAIRFVLMRLKACGKKKCEVSALKKLMANEEREYLANVDRSAKRIAEFGAKEIPKGATVLIHCHSSTLMGILKRAYDMGKGIRVICTETRPKYQGRMSAKELSDYGLDVTMIVDSAVESVMHEIDLVMVGADAITSKGDLVNKIGTAGIARLAYDHDIKFYSAAELHKYDPMTLWGEMEKIEERDAGEVVDVKEAGMPRVKIRNPAFDLTQAKFISAYVTELGVIAPQGLLTVAMKEFSIENPM